MYLTKSNILNKTNLLNICLKKYNISQGLTKLFSHNTKISNQSQDHAAVTKVSTLFNSWRKKFIDNNISEPQQSIEYILAHVLKTPKISDLYKKFSCNVAIQDEYIIEQLCKKRMLKMPIQYILGEWNFRELILKMEPPVFIPRPETELLIDIILEDLKEITKNIEMLEICCGSGAISLSLLNSNKNIKATAIDKSMNACNLSLKNAKIHQLNDRLFVKQYQITNEHRLQEMHGKFDLIVSNPPYVPSKDVLTVQPEIKLYEDLDALDGGGDGLDIIKLILSIAKEKLHYTGRLYLETDPSHPEIIKKYLQEKPTFQLKFIDCYKDFCGNDRFVKIEKC